MIAVGEFSPVRGILSSATGHVPNCSIFLIFVREFELQIPVHTFVGEKDGLIKKCQETMKADKHPTIAFRLANDTPAHWLDV